MKLAPITSCFLLLLAQSAALGADSREYSAALKTLQKESLADGNPDAFLSAFKTVLEGDDARSVRTAVSAYGKLLASQKLADAEYLAFHGKAAGAFAAVTSKPALEELKKQLLSQTDWRGRLLSLDAAGFAKGLDRLESALKALHDEHPVVVRRALSYLAKAKQLDVVDAIVARYMEVGKKGTKGKDGVQWERTQLAFQSALQQLLRVDLSAPQDYKNYVEAHRKDPHLFDPEKAMGEGSATSVTLFGAAVTGKNIVFVLDISGSMLTTDPAPKAKKDDPDRGKTVVSGVPGGGLKPKPEEDLEARRRITRAKRELTKVVKSLPSDVKINLIAYSSDVSSWKKTLVPASDANKKAASEYIDELKADGITVTDMALEEAFRDLSVDTIYLITDGAPTHLGSLKPGLPEDAPEIMEQIHVRTKQLNFLRDVRIFTLGFREAHEEFLKKLSADNGGKYVAIE